MKQITNVLMKSKSDKIKHEKSNGVIRGEATTNDNKKEKEMF